MGCNCQTGNETCGSTNFVELDKYIDGLLKDGKPERRSGYLIQVLHRAQSLYGYLSEETQQHVADKLGLHLADVYGVISFYSYFTDKPVGRFKINICTGTACFVKGAGKVLDEFKRQLNVKEGETTADGKYFLGALRCVGACSLAPVVMVNDKVYGNVTSDKVAEIIAACTD